MSNQHVTFRNDMHVGLLDCFGNDSKVARVARVSTRNDEATPERDARLVNTLVSEGHMVPLEHAAMTFRIECPIFVSRQIATHRMSSISELSGRYSEMPPEFYVPGAHRKMGQIGSRMAYDMVDLGPERTAATQGIIEAASEQAWRSYEDALRMGAAREVARMVLPVNAYTEIRMTMNLRSLLNFLSLRVDWKSLGYVNVAQPSHPQWEVQEVALDMAEHLEDNFPAVWRAFQKKGFAA